jgi:hypothetical protein
MNNCPETKGHEINLVVNSQRGNFSHAFPKTSLISDVIAAAASSLGYDLGDCLDLVMDSKQEHPLKPDHTLASYELADGAKLILSDRREDEVHLKVCSQRGDFEHAFPKTSLISNIIAAAATKLGFDLADRLELVLSSNRKQPLAPHHSVESYNLHNGTKLLLTAIGCGV